MVDAENGGLTWDRWELGVTGRAAVFRFIIPTDKFSYTLGLYCCLPDADGREAFRRYVEYHVVIAVDPQSGAIMRLQLQVDLKIDDAFVPIGRYVGIWSGRNRRTDVRLPT